MASQQYASPSTEAMLTAWALYIDRLTAELADAFGASGITCILLKGPAIARWLYDDGSVRSYSDCDLLVSPGQVPAAQGVLRELGFRDIASPLGHPWLDSHEWQRDEHHVDLHATLIGIRASPQQVWDVLSANTETLMVGGAAVRVLGVPARALHVVLHAAQHGPREPHPLEDLRRACDVVSEQTWVEVAVLAERLQATEAFATGLRLLPAGAAIAGRLGLASARSADATLRLEPVPLALALEYLACTPGLGARLRIVMSELFPTVAFMRWWSPLARRGPIGLAAAYCWRPLWLLARLGPGLVAWRQARRATG